MNELREGGFMPAVYYGPKEVSTSIAINAKEFGKVWKKAGESSIVILKDEKGNEHEALISTVDVHPVSGIPRHADFYVVEKGKKVKVAVALSFEGVSPAVKEKGAILVKVRREIEIEAAPRDLPSVIIVDISKLVEFADTIHAKDIVLPAGVVLKTNPEDVVASVSEAKEEVEEAPAAIDMSSIEIEAKGKEVKEGEVPAEGAVKGENEGSKTPEGKKPEKK